MTIDEAIKELSRVKRDRWMMDGTPINNALKLGIEALKQLKLTRSKPLPGETV